MSEVAILGVSEATMRPVRDGGEDFQPTPTLPLAGRANAATRRV